MRLCRRVTWALGYLLVTYTYDADGIRVGSETNGATTAFVVDKNRQYAQVLEERTGTGSLTVSYVYGDDLISQHRAAAFYYLYDGQLSTRALTNPAGDITDTYSYDAFGNLIDQAGTNENNYRYTGEQFDPNAGFYYLRARYYDQGVGRFATTDPYQGRMHEPVTLHKYLYANANPVMYNDPSGNVFSFMGFSISNAISSNLRKSNDARKAFRAYKKVRKSLCVAAATSMRHAHHAVPMFMGGHRSFSRNSKVRLPKNFHIEFHRLLHYMLRMADLPGGNTNYKDLYKQNPATRVAAHKVLILACRVFDKQCKSKVGYPITPIIRNQIKKGDWDF